MKNFLDVIIAVLCVIGVLVVNADAEPRTTTKLAEGVYVIRHPDAPDTFPQSNTTVIIGEHSVLVVDSCYLPSAAREDIAEIRKLTDKPVRYLLNTHWHYDHTMGNGTYAAAFPGLDIIAHVETQRQVAGYNPGWFERFPARADSFKKTLETGKDPNGKELSESEKQEYRTALAGLTPVQEEFSKIVDRPPNISFNSELNIDLGNRQVEIKHLGRANTAGDALVYLPKERIVITGDLVVHPIPYMFGGYPREFAKTLAELNRLDYATLVPGHGAIMQEKEGRAYVELIGEMLRETTRDVSAEVHRVGSGERNLAKVREAMKSKAASWRLKFAGNDTDLQDQFDNTYTGLIGASFYEILGR